MNQSEECTGDISTCRAGNGDEDGVPCPSCQAENSMAAAEYASDFGKDLSPKFSQRGTQTEQLKSS